MIWRKGILVITCLLLLITVASALIADSGHMSISSDWIVANTFDNTTITVRATNMSSGGEGVAAVPVNFFVDDVLYGNVSPSANVTNGFGYATSTFTVNKTSGRAFFNATVPLSVGGAPLIQTYSGWINLDHGPAYSQPPGLDYQGEVIVDQTTPFIVTLKDQYGNRVDNKNPAFKHTVKFSMNLPPGGLGTGGLKNETSDYLHLVYGSTDSKGNISLTAKVDTVPGENNINIFPIENMGSTYYPFITGITQAPPFFIEQVVSPDNPPNLPADRISYFSIQYTLFDKFRNPAGSQQLHIFTSEGEDLGNITSNSLGQIGITFGPRSTTGSINITAVAVANASVHCSKTVEFLSTDPVSMVVTANPQMIPSRDVPTDPPVTAEIIAKIMDISGNPVEGETVSFNLTGYTNSTILITRPSFSSSTYLTTASNATDSDGNAVVTFYAGEFPTSGPTYNSTATGTATISGTWHGKTMPITITFKNYPYLRVETRVTPPTVNVTDTFDVDIRLIGDGWKLEGNQIDAVMCTDRSGSMLYDNPDRMVSVMNASKSFVNTMYVSAARDHIGLVSFGTNGFANLTPTYYYSTSKMKWRWDWSQVYSSWKWVYQDNNDDGATWCGSDYCDNYNNLSVHHLYVLQNYTGNRQYTDYAVLEQSLSSSKTAVLTAIGKMVPSGGTPMRYGIYNAINDIKNNGRSGSSVVRAVIVLSDGDYNWYGDPLARGTGYSSSTYGPTDYGDLTQSYMKFSVPVPDSGQFSNQNMSVYAKNNNIKIYTIGFASSISTDGKKTLSVLANATGGKYFDGNAANIEDIYKTIAGELRILAGVNTQMNLSFQNVNVTYNNVTNQMQGKQVFTYIYKSGESTWVTSWNKTQNPLQDQIPKPPSPPYTDVLPNFGTYTKYNYSFNQVEEWLSTSGLKFNAGNITINQTWETKFRFRVNATGNIDIFGPGSKIIFNNGESELELPHTYISAVQNLTNVGLNATTLDIYNLHSTVQNVTNDYIPLSWQINYGGNQTVTEEISWQRSGGPTTWTRFQVNYISNDTHTDYAVLNVRSFEPGTYYIRVKASAIDAADDYEFINAPGFSVGTAGRIFIKIE